MSDADRLVNITDYEKRAKRTLPKSVYDYYASGAGDEFSLQWNKNSFKNFRIRQRFMRDVSTRDLSTTVLGCHVSMPIGVSPTAMQKMAHPLGECATAKAAGAVNTIYTMSTISTSSIEEVSEYAPHTCKWFQLYIYKDREVTKQLIARAEAAGFKAFVLTVDAAIFGIRYADARNKFTLPSHLTMANFSGLKATLVQKSEKGSGLNEYVNSLFDQSLTWADVTWLKSVTKLPIVLKGIMTAEDALIAADLGVAAILVSNHGARQIDNVPSPIEVLPEIVEAVGDRCDIYLDGGVRNGTDIFIALSLGAKMVFVGRPVIWGLAHDGENGVKKVLEILKHELDTTMTLTGCANLRSIKKEMVVPAAFYQKL